MLRGRGCYIARDILRNREIGEESGGMGVGLFLFGRVGVSCSRSFGEVRFFLVDGCALSNFCTN